MTKEQLELLATAVRRVIERIKATENFDRSHPPEVAVVGALEMLEHEFKTIEQITEPA